MRAKQSKFGKRSKPISKQILKTKQTPKRANFENKTEIQFQSSYAVYHKPSRSGRDGKPIPYKILRYIQIIVYRQRSKSHTFNQIPHYFIKQHVQDGKGNPSPTKFCAKKILYTHTICNSPKQKNRPRRTPFYSPQQNLNRRPPKNKKTPSEISEGGDCL